MWGIKGRRDAKWKSPSRESTCISGLCTLARPTRNSPSNARAHLHLHPLPLPLLLSLISDFSPREDQIRPLISADAGDCLPSAMCLTCHIVCTCVYSSAFSVTSLLVFSYYRYLILHVFAGRSFSSKVAPKLRHSLLETELVVASRTQADATVSYFQTATQEG
jgi:hypothetical protein